MIDFCFGNGFLELTQQLGPLSITVIHVAGERDNKYMLFLYAVCVYI